LVLSPEQTLDPAEERNDADADGHCELLTEEGKRGERSDVGRLPGDDSGNETSHAICCEAVFSYLIVAVASAILEIEVLHGESEIVAAGLVGWFLRRHHLFHRSVQSLAFVHNSMS
jgi:hypothetical protein